MVKYIRRIDGKFLIAEQDFLNFYYELIYQGVCYAHAHIQLATAERFAYCHVYMERFSAEVVKEMLIDWEVVLLDMRSFNIEKIVGTKVDGIKLWSRFVKLLGFKDIGPSILNNEPCMMAVMEL